jgi:hypothetical protein
MAYGQVKNAAQEFVVEQMIGKPLLDKVAEFSFRKKKPDFNVVPVVDCMKAHSLSLGWRMGCYEMGTPDASIGCEGDKVVRPVFMNGFDLGPKFLVPE